MDRHISRTVVVTGAAQGIGKALCHHFLTAGDRVAGLDIQASDGYSETFGEDSLSLTADISDRVQVETAMASVRERFGPIDVLINNASIVMARPFSAISSADWRRVLSVNLDGVFHCVQVALPLMTGTGGRIVNLSSHSGLLGSRDRAAYAASKGGVNALTRVLAVELAESGITVNAVAPGPVDTPHARAAHSDERRQAWNDALPIKRYGTEEEMAAVVAFLASPAAAYITGQIISVDGGFTAAGIIATG